MIVNNVNDEDSITHSNAVMCAQWWGC